MTTTGILSSGTQSMADFSRSMNMPLEVCLVPFGQVL